ncbi:IS3 family transposase, partial [Escherichia coli]
RYQYWLNGYIRQSVYAYVNYIECDYNRWRRHNACGGLSPEQFENQNLT